MTLIMEKEKTDEVLEEMKSQLADRIRKETDEFLQRYSEACLAMKMTVDLTASINIVHYSGNGRRSNRPMTIPEVKVSVKTSGIINWND